MDINHSFSLSNMIVLGDLFFFTPEGIQKEEKLMTQLFDDFYKNVSFN